MDLWGNPIEILNEIESEQVYTIAVTNSPSVFNYTYTNTLGKKYVQPSLGLHPELAFQRKRDITEFINNIKKTRYIGEVGLDYSTKDLSDRNYQREVFKRIIDECSKFGDKILTIHSRRAFKDVIDIIGDNFPGGIILHWYSGSKSELEKALKYGYYFSVNLAMTKSESCKNIIRNIPLDRLLTESDGPFVSDINKKCSPLSIPKITQRISEIYEKSENDIKQIVFQNFKKLLN
jgi:TatD DNase family protein